jgi:S-layer protein
MTLTNFANSNVVVDASTATGKVTYGIEAGATGVTFKGGSGNDKVIVLAGDLASASNNASGLAGNGGTDTLQINDTAPVYAQINKAAGFEVLELGTTGATVDVAQVTAMTGFATGAGNITATFNNSKSTTTYSVTNTSGNTGTVTINNAVGEQSTAVTLDYVTATSAQTLTALTITGAANVALTSTGTGTGGSNVITTLTNIDNSSITVTGTKDLAITNAIAATATGSKVDANALTGKFTVIGSTKADVIIGGSNDDTISNRATGGSASAADSITTGAGNDTVTLRGDVASGVLSTVISTASRITDFRIGGSTSTTDILQLSATVGNYSGGSGLFAGIAAAANGSTALQSVAQNASAAAIVAGTDVLKLTTAITTTSGTTTLQQAFNTAIGTATITGLTASDDIFFTFYDNTTARMIVGLVDAGGAGTNTIVETGDTVTLIGTVDMTAADYALFTNAQLGIVAA